MITVQPTPAEHADATADLVTEVARDVAHLGLIPFSLQVQWWETMPVQVSVHLSDTDTVGVDAVADFYGLGVDDPGVGGNYTRSGVVSVAGRDVTVHVYTGRPESAEVSA